MMRPAVASEDSRVVRSQTSVMVPVDSVKVRYPTSVVRYPTLMEKYQTSVIWKPEKSQTSELHQHLKYVGLYI